MIIEIILTVLLLGILYQFISEQIDKRRFPPIGTFIKIQNRILQVVYSKFSNDGPTVILEAGNGLSASSWMLIQPEISKFANCLSYDRAGFGWSEGSLDTCMSEKNVEDLHEMILKLNLPKPYILVGHSYGGMLNRLYEKKYPEEVAGIVLVDAYHEKQLEIIPLPSIALMNLFSVISFLGIFRLFIQKLFPLPSSLPLQMRKKIHAEISTYAWIKTTKNIFSNVEKSLKPFKNMSKINKPLTVISAGIHTGPELKFKDQIIQLQKDLVNQSAKGQQIIAEKSGHNIPFSQPEIIINAVCEMVEVVKSTTSA